MNSLFRWRLVVVLGAVVFSLPVTAQWPPQKLENLQVHPADTEVRELMQTMREFSFGLGVRCQHCHVGEEGKPLSTFDFAADDKAAKKTARSMLRMVQAINNEHLSALGNEPDERVRVECVTCHRGVAKPEQLPDVLLKTALKDGSDGATKRYTELREQYYGSHSFDFSEGSLVQAAEALLEAKQAAAAVALLEINLEHYPESQWTLGTLAEARSQNQDKAGAIKALERLLELRPDSARVKQQLEGLKADSGQE